jgi:hypothetical protein
VRLYDLLLEEKPDAEEESALASMGIIRSSFEFLSGHDDMVHK